MTKKKLTVKQLESYLQDLDDFEEPKIGLEQYSTPPHVAALILNTIDSTFDGLRDKLIADLGCGTGRLTVGSILSGARLVCGFDVDKDALGSALKNISYMFSDNDEPEDLGVSAHQGCTNFNLIQADIASKHHEEFWDSWSKMFDTVVLNPPFGTKQNQGLDMIFLERAIQLSQHSVYSLHKTSTREYILGKTRQWGVKHAKPIAQIRYNLDNTYKFHRRKSVDIDVDLWQIKL